MKALLAAALALPLLAGCLSGDRPGPWQPPSIMATYRFESTDGAVQPYTIDTDVMDSAPRRDRDDTYHEAHWQRSTALGFGGKPESQRTTRVLLDGGLRAVRMDQECFVVTEDGCLDSTQVRWTPRFGPTLHGYGWPQLLARGEDPGAAYAGTPWHWTVTTSREDGLLVLAVSYGNGNGGTERTLYSYAGAEWLPVRIEGAGWRMLRESYREGAPLASIALWPDLAPKPVQPSASPLPLPDADRDLLGAGLSPQQAYDAILGADAGARSIMDGGGCVVSYGVGVPPDGEPQPTVPPVERQVSDHDLTLAAADGTLHAWRLSVTEDLLGERHQTVKAGDDKPYGDASCLAGAEARTATTPAGSVLTRLQAFGDPNGFLVTVGQPQDAARPAATGWVTYRFSASGLGQRDSSATGLRTATFDASQGLWVDVEGYGPGFGVDQNR